MAGGGKSPKSRSQSSSFSTQRIGDDPTSRFLSNRFAIDAMGPNERIRPGRSTDIGTTVLENAGKAGGLRDPSLTAIGDVVSGKFLDPSVLGAEIEAASAPALRQFRRSIAPSIASEFAASGRTGSGAERAAFTDANDALSRNIAEVAAGAIAGERGRQLQAAGFLPQLQAAELQRGQALIDAGINEQNLQRENRDAAFNRRQAIAGALPGLRIGESTSSSSSVQTGGKKGKGGALGTIAGGALGSFLGPVGSAAGASLGNKLFSPGAPA